MKHLEDFELLGLFECDSILTDKEIPFFYNTATFKYTNQEGEKIEPLVRKIRRDIIGSPRPVGVTTETEMEKSLRPRVGSSRKRAHRARLSLVCHETVVVLRATR